MDPYEEYRSCYCIGCMCTLSHVPLILQKLQKNYDALLQMYGEKAEEAEELKLDLLDVKAMYRSQVMD